MSLIVYNALGHGKGLHLLDNDYLVFKVAKLKGQYKLNRVYTLDREPLDRFDLKPSEYAREVSQSNTLYHLTASLRRDTAH